MVATSPKTKCVSSTRVITSDLLLTTAPVYSNFAAPPLRELSHAPTDFVSPSCTPLAPAAFPLPTAEQIATDIINHIHSASTYNSTLESVVRRNVLLSFKRPLIEKIRSHLASAPVRSYKALDDIVVQCLRDLGF